MDWTIPMFLTVAVLVFGLAMIVLGIFSAYFGKGKNRSYGLVLSLIGAICFFGWLYLTVWSGIKPFCDVNVWDLLLDTLIQLLAVVVGILIAAGIFLVTVLKS